MGDSENPSLIEGKIYHLQNFRGEIEYPFCMFVEKENLFEPSEPWLVFGQATSIDLFRVRIQDKDYKIIPENGIVKSASGIHCRLIDPQKEHTEIVLGFLKKFKMLGERAVAEDVGIREKYSYVSRMLDNLAESEYQAFHWKSKVDELRSRRMGLEISPTLESSVALMKRGLDRLKLD